MLPLPYSEESPENKEIEPPVERLEDPDDNIILPLDPDELLPTEI